MKDFIEWFKQQPKQIKVFLVALLAFVLLAFLFSIFRPPTTDVQAPGDGNNSTIQVPTTPPATADPTGEPSQEPTGDTETIASTDSLFEEGAKEMDEDLKQKGYQFIEQVTNNWFAVSATETEAERSSRLLKFFPKDSELISQNPLGSGSQDGINSMIEITTMYPLGGKGNTVAANISAEQIVVLPATGNIKTQIMKADLRFRVMVEYTGKKWVATDIVMQ